MLAYRLVHWTSAWLPLQGSGPPGPAIRQAIHAPAALPAAAGTTAGRRAATQLCKAVAAVCIVRGHPAVIALQGLGPGSCQGRPSSGNPPSGLTPGVVLLPATCSARPLAAGKPGEGDLEAPLLSLRSLQAPAGRRHTVHLQSAASCLAVCRCISGTKAAARDGLNGDEPDLGELPCLWAHRLGLLVGRSGTRPPENWRAPALFPSGHPCPPCSSRCPSSYGSPKTDGPASCRCRTHASGHTYRDRAGRKGLCLR